MQKQSFSLENVHCSSCEAKVVKTLSQLEGVQDVNVNVLRKTMLVTFSDEKLGVGAIVSAMQQAGFSATPTRFTAHEPSPQKELRPLQEISLPAEPLSAESTKIQSTTKTASSEEVDSLPLLQPFPMAPPSALQKMDAMVEKDSPKAPVTSVTEQAFMLSRAHCASCQGKIHAALMALEGIKEAHVNTLSKSIVVFYDAERISPKNIEEHFVGSKYAMTPVQKKELPPLIPDITQVKQRKLPKNKESVLPTASLNVEKTVKEQILPSSTPKSVDTIITQEAVDTGTTQKDADVATVQESVDTATTQEAVDTATVQESVDAATISPAQEEDITENFSKDSSETTQKQKFAIGNVHCTSCSAKVEKLLLSMDGIESVAVNVLGKSMLVAFDTSLLSSADISKAMEKAGFTAKIEQGMGDSVQQPLPSQDIVYEEKTEEKSIEKNIVANAGPKFWEKLPLSLLASLFFAVILMYVAMAPMFSLPLPLFLDMTTHPLAWAVAQCLLTLPILCIHRQIFISGVRALCSLSPNMDSLVGLGSATAAFFGMYALSRMYMAQSADDMATVQYFANNLYFDSSGMILALIGLGKHFESKARERTGSAIDALMRLAPPTAICLRNGEEVLIPTAEIRKEDVLVVHAGQSLAADGIIIQGSAFIDTSAITGESLPQEKSEGDTVIGATLCQSGYFHMQVTRAGAESTLAHIIDLVESATASKAPIARLADRISAIFVPIIIAIAIIAFGTWLMLGAGLEFALSIAISVLVISCPCALGLATPTAIMVGMGMGAEHGILFKSAAAIERMQDIDTVVLDKTGTLTHGKPVVTDIYPYSIQELGTPIAAMQQTDSPTTVQKDMLQQDVSAMDESQEESSSDSVKAQNDQENTQKMALLHFAASIEKLSEHPLGQAIVHEAKVQNVTLAAPESYGNFTQMPGLGIRAEQDGQRILAGNARLIAKENIDNPLMAKEKELARQGKTVLYFAKDQTLLGLIAMADTVKETSKEAVQDLKTLGLTVLMLTGDNALTAKAVQEYVDIENILAEVLPQEKEEKVRQLQSAGHKVIMVGDGINDAPALARAHVGIAVGQGTDIALQSSDIVLMQSDVSHVAQALKLSKAVMRTIKQNLFWAFAYNSILIPVAAGLFYTAFGLTLNPMLAAASMSLSSLTVVGNALRLRMHSKKIF